MKQIIQAFYTLLTYVSPWNVESVTNKQNLQA